MSHPAKRTTPAVGVSAPAIPFLSGLFPEPFGPMRPWNSFSPTVRSTPRNAVKRAKTFLMPRTSRSGMLALVAGFRQCARGAAERADALTLRKQQSDQAAGSEDD